jgi:hypothetical protein
MTTRRDFIKNSAMLAGGAALLGGSLVCTGKKAFPQKG